MRQSEERYISLLTDFGFKRIFDRQPAALKEKVFTKLFEEAEIAQFTPTELREYEDSVKVYRDLKNSLDTAMAQGIEKGLKQGRAEGLAQGLEKGRVEGFAEGGQNKAFEIARNLKSEGMPLAVIVRATGLTEEEIIEL